MMLLTVILGLVCLTMLGLVGALVCIVKMQDNTMRERLDHVEPPKISSWLDADWRKIQ